METKGQKVTEKLLESIGDATTNINLQKGLQQYYTPQRFAEFLCKVFADQSSGHLSVLDITCGAGSLLLPFTARNVTNRTWNGKEYETEEMPANEVYGVELDKENIPGKEVPGNFLHADFTQFYKYLKAVQFEADIFALNPPFGLSWDVSEDVPKNSVEATMAMAYELSHQYSGGYIIMSARNAEIITESHPELLEKVFFRLNVKGLFKPFSDVDSVVLFFGKNCRHYRDRVFDIDFQTAKDSEYDTIIKDISHVTYYDVSVTSRSSLAERRQNRQLWLAAVDRYKQDKGARKQKFSVELRGGKLRCAFTLYEEFTLAKQLKGDEISVFRQMNGVAPTYFSFNSIARRTLMLLLAKGMTIQPAAKAAIDKGLQDSAFLNAPFYDLKPQQRLGWLNDLTQIKCVKGGDWRGITYVQDTMYEIWTTSKVMSTYYGKEDKEGEFQKQQRVLHVTIGPAEFDESPDDIAFLIKHFDVPNPSNVRDLKPELYAVVRKIIESPVFASFTLTAFQVEDLSRACMKDAFVLAWEQGTGKTRGIIVWGMVKAILENNKLVADIVAGKDVTLKHVVKAIRKRFLVVMPKNIMGQWQKFLTDNGINATVLSDVIQANKLRRTHASELEFYITDYGIIKSSRRFPNQSPCEVQRVSEFYLDNYLKLESSETFWEKKNHTQTKQWQDYLEIRRMQLFPSSCKEFCPKCKTVKGEGWNGYACKKCSTNTYGKRFKGMAYVLKHVFDIIALDESERIKNKDTLVGRAILGMRAKYKCCSSGTPIKAYIRDMYSVMHWVLGNASPRFPYDYANGGMDKFLTDYGVWETRMEDRRKGLAKSSPKLLPEISNLALWWKLFFPAAIRRRQEEIDEEFVNIKFHYTAVPFAKKQHALYQWWIANFAQWYKENRNEEASGNPSPYDLIKGLLWKMRFTATNPDSKNLWAHNGLGSGSNFTPKNLAIIKQVSELLKDGRRIVVFSALKDECAFLDIVLNQAGVKSEVVNGDIPPLKQGEKVLKFQQGKLDVLICGIDAMKSGHDISEASAAVVCDFPWNSSDFRQAVKRIHRKSSKRDVDVFVVYTAASVDERMKDLVEKKGAMSDIAIDGELISQDSEDLDFVKILKETIELFKKSETGADELEIEREARKELESLGIALAGIRNRPLPVIEGDGDETWRDIPDDILDGFLEALDREAA